jgi:RNA polymerase sigma-70 factor (ECF subfamily)
VALIATGDQGALRALYQRAHRIVFTLAVRICTRREIAEEVTLDVFHEVWRRSGTFEPTGGSVVGWVMNLARSRAIDRIRFEQRKKRASPDGARGDELHAELGPADSLFAVDRRGELNHALSTLTVDERQAIETAFFGELTYAEAAVRLNEPVGTIKTRVRSALAKLRKTFASKGGKP